MNSLSSHKPVTVAAVAGQDFAVIAADTRISIGYSIQSRTGCKLSALSSKCVLGTSGMQADMTALFKNLKTQTEKYKHDHGREMTTTSLGQLLSNTLYYKRFFPYYTFNVLAGVDANGVGCVYSYDAIGSVERLEYNASGTGSALIMPVLDNQVGHKNLVHSPGPLTKEAAVDLIKDAMTSAGERDIYTGDSVDIAVIDAEGIHWERFELKRD